MARRKYELPHGEGSFYQTASGRWIGSLDDGWTERGTRRRVTVSSKDKAEAWDKLMALRKRVASGQPVGQSAPTVKSWAAEWLEHRATHVAASTLPQYRSRVKRWIIPHLGRLKLNAIRPAHVRDLWQAMRDDGRSETTLKAVTSTLMDILRAAVEEGHAVPPSVLAMERPTAALSTRDAIPLDDALALVKLATMEPDGARWIAALLQGMRQAECLGLTWGAIDFDGGTIDVSWQLVSLPYGDRDAKTFKIPPSREAIHLHGTRHLTRPKSRAGVRVIPMVPWMRDALLAWREVAPANPWGLVWPGVTRSGVRPMQPDHDREAWYALQERAGVSKPDGSRYVVHEARHTAASLLLLAGVDAEIVRQIMGHSTVAMSRRYQHTSRTQVLEALTAAAERLQLDG